MGGEMFEVIGCSKLDVLLLDIVLFIAKQYKSLMAGLHSMCRPVVGLCPPCDTGLL